MGYERAKNIQPVRWKDLSAGWFPGKEHNLVPDNGASDCDNVIWHEGSLQKMFGYDNVTTSALQGGLAGNGMIEFTQDSHNLVGVVGTRVYENLQNAVPDLLVGVTLTTGLQCDMIEFNNGTTNMIVGVNGTDAPWSFDGTTLQALAGSPPTGRWIEYFNNHVWIARHTNFPDRIYYSAVNSATSWDTTDGTGNYFVFDGPITGVKSFGTQLVVFKNDSIGVLTGYGVTDFVEVPRFINGVGCVGGHTIVEAKLGGPAGKAVLVFLAHDGIYAFDGTPNLIKLSNPIERKFIGGAAANRWNESRYANAVGTFSTRYQWYILGVSDSGDTTNDFQLALDLSRPFNTPDNKTAVPHWPFDGPVTNAICVRRNANNREDLYFMGSDGLIYLYDPTSFNRNGAAYTAFWTSKIFDMEQTWILREMNGIFEQLGDFDVELYLNADQQTGLGEMATVNTLDTGAVLDSFVLDTDVLGGNDFLNLNADIVNSGRFLQWSVRSPDLNSPFSLRQMELQLKMIGTRPNL